MPKKSTKKNKKQLIKPSKPKNKVRKKINTEQFLIFSGILIIITALIIRLFAFESPIMGDEATYSILGKKSVSGNRLYVDFYEMKPPLLYYCYGIGSLLFGWSTFGLRALGFFLVLFNSSLILILLKRYGSLGLSILGAGMAFFFMNNIYTYATETVSEHFVLSFVLGGFVLLTSKINRNRYLIIFLSGFLIAGGAMIKQTAAIYGIGALIWMIIQTFNSNDHFARKDLFRNILLLASGALSIILLMLLAIIFGGGLEDAKYWLIEFPNSYTSKVSFEESKLYFRTFLGRAIRYQMISFIVASLLIIIGFIQIKKRYFSLVFILIICSFLNTIPGLRFYGQYWIPLFIILPLGLLGANDALKLVKNDYLKLILPLIILISVGGDVIINKQEYFEKGYMLNAEKSHNGNFPSVLYALLNDLKPRMKPSDKFYMLGSQTQSYIVLDRFPEQKHIYPKLLGKDTERNDIYQKESYNELISIDPDYVLFSVSGLSWRGSGSYNDWLYNSAFNYVVNNYEPIWIFNYNERKYYNMENGDNGDLYVGNQLISFKKR